MASRSSERAVAGNDTYTYLYVSRLFHRGARCGYGDAFVHLGATGLDLGDPLMLRRYEQLRRNDNIAFSAATDILDRLFSNDLLPIALARRVGLGAVNHVPPLRRFFMRRAMGAAGAISRLGRGEKI